MEHGVRMTDAVAFTVLVLAGEVFIIPTKLANLNNRLYRQSPTRRSARVQRFLSRCFVMRSLPEAGVQILSGIATKASRWRTWTPPGNFAPPEKHDNVGNRSISVGYRQSLIATTSKDPLGCGHFANSLNCDVTRASITRGGVRRLSLLVGELIPFAAPLASL